MSVSATAVRAYRTERPARWAVTKPASRRAVRCWETPAGQGYWPLFAVDGATALIFALVVAVWLPADPAKEDTWEYALTVALWSVGEAAVAGIAALAAGSFVYAAGPSVLWWGSLLAGTASASAIAVLSPAIARRAAQQVLAA